MVNESDIRRKPKLEILFEENRATFNKGVAEGKLFDLVGANMSSLDLRGFNFKNHDLSNTYMRDANLSGLDLSGANLSGASLKSANISGCLFPKDLSAEEIQLSVSRGTRLRHR